MKKPSPKSRPADVEFPFQLTDVRLYEIDVDRARADEPTAKGLPISVRLVAPKTPPSDTSRAILLEFHTAVPDTEGRRCKIDLTLEARFLAIPDTEPLSAEDLTDFEAQHAIVLIWPYLRQILHDLTSKLGLPVPPLPVIDPRALVASTGPLAAKPLKARPRKKSTRKSKARERV